MAVGREVWEAFGAQPPADSYADEGGLRRRVALSPQEQADNTARETSERTRASLDSAIAEAPHPAARAALEETRRRDFGPGAPSTDVPDEVWKAFGAQREPAPRPTGRRGGWTSLTPPSVTDEGGGQLDYLLNDLRVGWNTLRKTVEGQKLNEWGELLSAFDRKYTPEQVAADPKLREERALRESKFRETQEKIKAIDGESESLQKSGRPSYRALQEANDGSWTFDNLSRLGKTLVENPGSAVSIVTQSGPASAAMLASAVLARFAGFSGGVAAGAGGLASQTVEFGNDYAELREKGESHEQAYKQALIKSGVVGLLDAVSMKSAGNALDSVLGSGGFFGKVKRVGRELGTQAGLGMAGEAGGSLLSGRTPDPLDVLAEGVGELAMGPVEAVTTFKGRPRAPQGPERERDAAPVDAADILGRPAAPTADEEQQARVLTPSGQDPAVALRRADEIDALLREAPDAPDAGELSAEREQIAEGLVPRVAGQPTAFTTESGARIEAEFSLVEASDLVASHTPDMKANPVYPAELQPRDRSRAASELQVAKIAGNLTPERLGESGDAGTGAPIVGADGLVESGNARTIGIQRAYSGATPTAQRYRDWITANASRFGIDPDAAASMRAPVLVRVRRTPVNRVEFARQANQATVAQMSPSELARTDAARMGSLDALTITDDGEFMVPANDGIIRGFFRTLPVTEQAALVDANGRISQAGYARFRNALLAKAYGNNPVVARLSESMSPLLRNLTNALIRMAPMIAKAKEAMQQGAIAERDITDDIVRAVDELVRMRQEGRSLGQVLAQASMFPDLTPETLALMEFLDENVRAPARIGEFVAAYLGELERYGSQSQGDMFGGVEVPGRADLIKTARAKVMPDAQEEPAAAQGQPAEGGAVVQGGAAAAPQPAAAEAGGVAEQRPAEVPGPAPAGEQRPDEPGGRSGAAEGVGEDAGGVAESEKPKRKPKAEKKPAAAPSPVTTDRLQEFRVREKAILRKMRDFPDDIGKARREGRLSASQLAVLEEMESLEREYPEYVRPFDKQPSPAKQPSAEEQAQDATDANAPVRQQQEAERTLRLDRAYQRLMTQPRSDLPAIAAELPPDEAKALLERLDAAPGSRKEARDALAARAGDDVAREELTAQAPEQSPSAADVANVSVDDFERLLGEVQQERNDGTAPVTRPKRERKPKPTPAADSLKQAGQHAAAGVKQGFEGLDKLFGRKGTLGSGPSFDEETWAQAKPHFEAAFDEFVAAGRSLKEFIRHILDTYNDAIVPYLRRWHQDKLREASNADERGGTAAQPDGADVQDEVGPSDSQAEPGGAGDGRGPSVQGSADEGAAAGRNGVRDGNAVAPGEPGNQPVLGKDTTPGSPVGPAGSYDAERGGSTSLDGVQPDLPGTERAPQSSAGRPSLVEKVAAQKRAESVPIRRGEIDNIRDSLPFLLEGQQDDVAFAERRFEHGQGVLFTNGTGTGKTLTGLGIVKRFAREGKSNIIIVAPSDKIASDWVSSADWLGLKVTMLPDTRSAGAGIVVTTYANFGANEALFDRQWDLVITDESHYLMNNKEGSPSAALDRLRLLTRHKSTRYLYPRAKHPKEWADVTEAARMASALRSDQGSDNRAVAAWEAKEKAARAAWKPLEVAALAEFDAIPQGEKPRVVFLSATPFAYHFNVDYAEGYLFEFEGEQRTGYNQPGPRDAFYIQHFGYRMRTGKLSKPDANVDVGLMEIQFNGWLKRQGVLSSRMLDVEADYDRRFILVDDAIGTKIDEGMEFLRESGGGRLSPLYDSMREGFTYHNRMYLLEALKARHAVSMIREQLAKGRKVVVFHDFIKGGGFHPFRFTKRGDNLEMSVSVRGEDGKYKSEMVKWNDLVDEFNKARPDLVDLNFDGIGAPINVLRNAFPEALLFNGRVPKQERRQAVERFNGDDGKHNLIIVQSDAGREGISLHDTTGKYQRALINLGMPVRPTSAIQIEGRIYRTGQVSNAIFRYLNTGTNYEQWTFASKIAERAGTAENLAMGDDARALKETFIEAFEGSGPEVSDGTEGTGGKARDRTRTQALTPFQRAKSYYYGTQKRNSRTKSAEGTDYFATPEPLGLKMVEWADIRPGDRMLEPSAGHAAIGRFFPQGDSTLIEASYELVGRAKLAAPDSRLLHMRFEDHEIVNKYDVIVMNPPFGQGGSMAIAHLAKAARHLNDGGRIVALLPEGPAADKRLEKFLYGTETRTLKPVGEWNGKPVYRGDVVQGAASGQSGTVTRKAGDGVWIKRDGVSGESFVPLASIKNVEAKGPRSEEVSLSDGLHLVADIGLPTVTFERAGTGVKTHIIVLEKQLQPEQAAKIVQRSKREVQADNIGEFFDAIESMEMRGRVTPSRVSQAAPARAAAPQGSGGQVAAQVTPAAGGNFYVTDAPEVTYTTRKGKVITGVVAKDLTQAQAKEIDPFTWKYEGGFFIRMKHVQRRSAPKMSRAGDGVRFAANALYELAATDEVFRYPVSKSSDLQSVFEEVMPAAEFLGNATRPEEDRDSGADRRFMFRTNTGRDFYVYERGRDVWIDVSALQQGEGGAQIYAAVLNYAHNAKKRLIGDPKGLSVDAIIRRTSAMLSSALRFGTTRHMAAATEQMAGDPEARIAPLKWGGSDAENVRNLIDSFLETLYARVPDLRGMRYDFGRQQFIDSEGARVRLEDFGRLSQETGPRDARAGEGTLRRGALLQSLVSSEAGQRPGILQAVLSRAASLAREGDLTGILSRRFDTETPADAGVSASVARVSAELEARMGRPADALGVKIVGGIADLPDGLRSFVTSQDATDTQGVFDPKTGDTYLVASNIAPGRAFAVYLHELGVHKGMLALLGREQMSALVRTIKEWAAGSTSEEGRLARIAVARIPEGTPPGVYDEELLAYFVEEAVKAGHDIPRSRPERGRLAQWLHDLWAAVRGALEKLGVAPETLTASEVVALARGAAERAMAGTGQAESPSIVRSVFEAPWYSALLRAVRGAKLQAAPAAQWAGTIKAMPGVKADEVEWSGVLDWLATQPGKVTREQVVAYLEQNGVRLEEVVLGKAPRLPAGRIDVNALSDADLRYIIETSDRNADVDGLSHSDLVEMIGYMELTESDIRDLLGDPLESEARRIAAENGENWASLSEEERAEYREDVEIDAQADESRMEAPVGGTKYSNFQLPGGENYRELLLKLPDSVNAQLAAIDARIREISNWPSRQEDAKNPKDQPELNRLNREWLEVMRGAGRKEFKSTHFTEPNIVAHVRFNERTDADGRRVLFLEELQSDWAQKGRKDGFRGASENYKVKQQPDGTWSAEDDAGGGEGGFSTRGEAQRWADAENARDPIAVPPAPFVTKTEAWVSLALKRMIRYAAEHGFDAVAWTTGEQQAARYDLSKQISKVRWDDASTGGVGDADLRASEGRGILYAYDLNGNKSMERAVEHTELPDLIGKEAAERLLNASASRARSSGGTGIRRRELAGLELKVGGEGMKSFYDRIVPAVAKDALKKLGGGQIEDVTIPVATMSDEDFQQAARADDNPSVANVRGFAITPELRAKAMQGMPLFSRAVQPQSGGQVAPFGVTVRQRPREGMLNRVVRGAFQTTRADRLSRGAVDLALRVGEVSAEKLTPAVSFGQMSWEDVKAGMVDKYGLDEVTIDRRAQMYGHQAVQLRGVKNLLDQMATLTRAEAAVLYRAATTADAAEVEEMIAGLDENSQSALRTIKQVVRDLGAEAVRLGQMTDETFRRNEWAYLHRSYLKHELDDTEAGKASRARRIQILGDHYKRRGLVDWADPKKIANVAPEFWGRKAVPGRPDYGLKGQKFTRLERRKNRGEGVAVLDGMEETGQRGRLLEVIYWPAGEAIPARYGSWDNVGTWEARFFGERGRGGAIGMWRDFTADERQKMGEIDDIRYAFAKTMHTAIHNVEVGKYLLWLADTHAVPDEDRVPEGATLVEREESGLTGLRRVFRPNEWVRVPDTRTHKGGPYKYGALAGKIVPGPIWNDVRQVVNNRWGQEWWNTLLRAWKVSKTAMSPAVHMNNIMANVVMADWHDVSPVHVLRSFEVLAGQKRPENKRLIEMFEDSGGTQGMYVLSEIQREQLDPVLEQLRRDLAGSQMGAAVGMGAAVQALMAREYRKAFAALRESKAGSVVKVPAQKLIDLYQDEDTLFRLAAFIKVLEEGGTPAQAGKFARRSFLDYDINAPWVQAMRNSIFPFISFTYRAVPMLIEVARERPWKLAKLAMILGAVNAAGYLFSGGDEDEERKLLPEEKAGNVLGLLGPKLLRMPWNDENGSPVFLDVRRWMPLGDFFDVGQTHAAFPILPAAVPGGPLAVLAEVVMNKSQFTGKPITKETDTGEEKATKVADHLFKAFAPNLPILPGTYSWTSITNAGSGMTDAFGREQSLGQAALSSVGVKVGSYPEDVLRRNLAAQHAGKVREIGEEISKIRRQYERKGITREQFEKRLADQVAKRVALERELAEKVGR